MGGTSFHPRCAADLPPTPDTFPRNSWLSLDAFGFPREYKYEACWAASNASMAWSRVLGVPAEVELDGSPYQPLDASPPPPADYDVVDDTMFMLALFDKVHEITWYARLRLVLDSKGTRQTYLQWTTWTDDVISQTYETACTRLSHTPGRVRPPPEFDEVYWFVRDALDQWADKWDLVACPPPRPVNYMPFPTRVLGRFAAQYEAHSYTEILDVPGAEPRLVVVPACPDVPPPWQPVEEGDVFTACGLAHALAQKDTYRVTLDAFLDDVEHAAL